jgi:cytochrome c peroxidase
MNLFFRNRRIIRSLYLAILIFLAILLAIFWRYDRSPEISPPIASQSEDVSRVKEPIQPIPLAIDLDRNKVLLGKQLFEDVRLSGNNGIACVSCHQFDRGGADGRSHSIGANRTVGEVNTPTVFNVGFNFWLNWNGEFDNLTDQLNALLLNLDRMGVEWSTLIPKLQEIPEYVRSFTKIYPDGLTKANLQDAIVTYEQSLYTPNSRFDRFLRGDKQILTPAEYTGYQLFQAYGCISCHQGVNVGGNMFQRFGVLGDYFADRGNITSEDLGRFNVTQDPADRFVFRVPSLRNVALTAPYFHDGTAKTLPEAIAVMAKYQLGRSLSQNQIDLIAQFLSTLTGEKPS